MHRTTPTEPAFTMIEMIVAMVLLALASGVVGTIVVQSIAGSAGARSGAVSDAAIRRTLDSMGDDIARAATSDRRDASVRDPNAFAAAVRGGGDAFKPARASATGPIDPSRAPVRADIDDVWEATPSRFRVRIGDQCVTWAVTATAETVDLVRSVGPATCTSTTQRRTFISSRRATDSGLSTTPFTYSLVCNPSACGLPAKKSGQECRPFVLASAPTNRRRWIVAVNASLQTVTSDRNSTSHAAGSLNQSIHSREVGSYREALGC